MDFQVQCRGSDKEISVSAAPISETDWAKWREPLAIYLRNEEFQPGWRKKDSTID